MNLKTYIYYSIVYTLYIYINLLSCPRTSPSLTRSNQHAFPLALQKTTAVGSKRVLTYFKNILLGKAASVSGWGGTKAYEPLTFVNQPRQCGLKEGIVNILKTTDKKCENFLGDSTTTTWVKHHSRTSTWKYEICTGCFVPGPRVPTPARGIVVDPLPLPRMVRGSFTIIRL